MLGITTRPGRSAEHAARGLRTRLPPGPLPRPKVGAAAAVRAAGAWGGWGLSRRGAVRAPPQGQKSQRHRGCSGSVIHKGTRISRARTLLSRMRGRLGGLTPPRAPCRFRNAPGPQPQLQPGPALRGAGRGRGWGTPRGSRGAGLAVGEGREGTTMQPPQRTGISPQTPQSSEAASRSLCQLLLRPHPQRSPRAGGSLGRRQPLGVLQVLSQPEASLGAHHVRGPTWGHSLCVVLSGDTPRARCRIPHVVLLRGASHVQSYLGTHPLWSYTGMRCIHGPIWGCIPFLTQLCSRGGTQPPQPGSEGRSPSKAGRSPSDGTAAIPAVQPLCPAGVCCPLQQMGSHWAEALQKAPHPYSAASAQETEKPICLWDGAWWPLAAPRALCPWYMCRDSHVARGETVFLGEKGICTIFLLLLCCAIPSATAAPSPRCSGTVQGERQTIREINSDNQ